MKTDLFHIIFRTIKKYLVLLFDIRSSFHRNFITFLFFVVLSSVFWFFRTLSKTYDTEILYPVKFVNLPENKVVIGELPEKLTLKVRATGRKVLLSKMNLNIIPLRFDVNSFIKPNDNPDTLFISTNTVREILSEGLKDAEILDIKPDTLVFYFTSLEVKKVPVVPDCGNMVNMFAPQYMMNGPVQVEPDSIVISGPETLLKNISMVTTEPLALSNLSDTISRFYNIEKQDKISLSQRKVRITIPVDRYTQAEFNLPVVAMNLPDSLILKTFPERVRVIYLITLSNYKKISPNWIMPHVDYREIIKNPAAKLPLFLVDTPEIINGVKFSPEKVEYLLSKP